jgi:hypothetical protein
MTLLRQTLTKKGLVTALPVRVVRVTLLPPVHARARDLTPCHNPNNPHEPQVRGLQSSREHVEQRSIVIGKRAAARLSANPMYPPRRRRPHA